MFKKNSFFFVFILDIRFKTDYNIIKLKELSKAKGGTADEV